MSGIIVGLVHKLPITEKFTSELKFTASIYAEHAWEDGTHAYPAVNTVAEITGYHERSIQRYLRVLVELGILIPTGKGPRGTNNFRFPLVTVDGAWKLDVKGGGDTVSPRQAATGDRDSGDRDSGDTSVTRINQPPLVIVVNKDEAAKVFQAYESEIGALTAHIRDEFNAMLDEDKIPPDWIVDAIHLAAEANARNLAYIRAIIKNWQARGKGAPKPGGSHANKSTSQRTSRKADAQTGSPLNPEQRERAERINAKRKAEREQRLGTNV